MKLFAAVQESGIGTELPIWNVRFAAAIEAKADVTQTSSPYSVMAEIRFRPDIAVGI